MICCLRKSPLNIVACYNCFVVSDHDIPLMLLHFNTLAEFSWFTASAGTLGQTVQRSLSRDVSSVPQGLSSSSRLSWATSNGSSRVPRKQLEAKRSPEVQAQSTHNTTSINPLAAQIHKVGNRLHFLIGSTVKKLWPYLQFTTKTLKKIPFRKIYLFPILDQHTWSC